jgi:hypothetical protein
MGGEATDEYREASNDSVDRGQDRGPSRNYVEIRGGDLRPRHATQRAAWEALLHAPEANMP